MENQKKRKTSYFRRPAECQEDQRNPDHTEHPVGASTYKPNPTGGKVPDDDMEHPDHRMAYYPASATPEARLTFSLDRRW